MKISFENVRNKVITIKENNKRLAAKYVLDKLSSEELELLSNVFVDSESDAELVYRVIHNIVTKPVCSVCGCKIPFKRGFSKYCSIKCSTNSNDRKKLYVERCLEKFGVENSAKSLIVKEKMKTTNLKKYGVNTPLKNENVKQKISQTKEIRYGDKNYNNRKKYRKTCLDKFGVCCNLSNKEQQKQIKETNIRKYGCEIPTQNKSVYNKILSTKEKIYGNKYFVNPDKTKETMLKRYGVDSYTKTKEYKEYMKEHIEEFKQKEYETKRKNGTFLKSKQEDKLYSLLCEKFGEDDIIRQYSSDKYPYNCDFYIKSKDLYIEYNGSHYHCEHPFDNTNKDDLFLLEQLKDKANNSKRHVEGKKSQYDVMIYVWTELDPRKRQTAKNNNLNYIEIWKLNEVENYF